MRAVVAILSLLITIYAHEKVDDNSESVKIEILEKVFSNISIDKKIVIWSDCKTVLESFKQRAIFETASSCSDASLIVLENKKELTNECHEKAIFVMDYKLLKEMPDSFGALFWKKGRPNIVIIAPRAKKRSIKISEKLDDYLEEKIW